MKTEDYSKYYIQGSDHYLMPKDEFVDLNEMVENLEKENKKLKDQLEELRNGYKNKLRKLLTNGIEPDAEDFYLAEIEGKANDYDKMKSQQKEFITFLEDNWKETQDIWYIKILNKFKEIIGE